MTKHQVGVAAEAYAAALLAHAGCDVSVQYGANQPGYDLVAVKGTQMMKVSVKGSQDGAWIMAGSYKEKGLDYVDALKLWEADQCVRTAYFLVQFEDVPVGTCPRAYFATPSEIALHLNSTRGGKVSLILHEEKQYVRGVSAGVKDEIPHAWDFTPERLREVFDKIDPRP